jgi:hypothetical protein
MRLLDFYVTSSWMQLQVSPEKSSSILQNKHLLVLPDASGFIDKPIGSIHNFL